jgi:hypothetical protein
MLKALLERPEEPWMEALDAPNVPVERVDLDMDNLAPAQHLSLADGHRAAIISGPSVPLAGDISDMLVRPSSDRHMDISPASSPWARDIYRAEKVEAPLNLWAEVLSLRPAFAEQNPPISYSQLIQIHCKHQWPF